ncbi:hypothetical protein SCALM49S_03939 [Streptomyces californicus]
MTLRTPAALASIRAMAAEVPDAVVGAGTVISPEHVRDTVDAGARFLVSPGWTDALLEAMKASGVRSCRASRPPPKWWPCWSAAYTR